MSETRPPPRRPAPPSENNTQAAPRPPAATRSLNTQSPTPTKVGPPRSQLEYEREEGVEFTLAGYKAGFVPREGDHLVVRYPAVKLPLSAQYTNIEVGGGVYSRQMLEGDDPVEQYERVYAYLQRTNEEAAKAAIRTWGEELSRAKGR